MENDAPILEFDPDATALAHLLAAADDLSSEEWVDRGFIPETSVRERLFWTAVEACVARGELTTDRSTRIRPDSRGCRRDSCAGKLHPWRARRKPGGTSFAGW